MGAYDRRLYMSKRAEQRRIASNNVEIKMKLTQMLLLLELLLLGDLLLLELLLLLLYVSNHVLLRGREAPL